MNSKDYNLSRDLRSRQLLQSEEVRKVLTTKMTAYHLQKTTSLATTESISRQLVKAYPVSRLQLRASINYKAQLLIYSLLGCSVETSARTEFKSTAFCNFALKSWLVCVCVKHVRNTRTLI